MKLKPIVIIGFMGSGKTTVARELARQLNCEAIDLDQVISEREQRKPGAIIEQDGEASFRELETRLLGEVLNHDGGCVVALGGGTWTVAVNRELIRKQSAFVVWLDTAFELCWKRIEAGDEARPLARSREQAHELFGKRRAVYELADASIEIHENDSVEEIAKKVVAVKPITTP